MVFNGCYTNETIVFGLPTQDFSSSFLLCNLSLQNISYSKKWVKFPVSFEKLEKVGPLADSLEPLALRYVQFAPFKTQMPFWCLLQL